MAGVTTGAPFSSTYMAAEYLVRRVGEEAAQQVNIAPVVWQQDLVDTSTMTAHFRFLDSLTTASATENADLNLVSWSPEGVTVSAGLYGFYVPISKVMNSITPDAIEKIAQQGGTSLARAVDTSLAALFPSLTAGTVGTSGAALTWANIVTGEADLDTYFAFGKRYGFVHPKQFADLKTDIATKNFGVSRTTTDAMGNEQIEIGSVTIRKNALVTTLNSAANYAGGIIVEEALGLAIAQQPMVEILPIPKQASYSVESSIAFGAGVIRPRFGVLVRSGV